MTKQVTRHIGALVQRRVGQSPVFRDAQLRDAVDRLLAGDVDAGLDALRTYIETTTGFVKVGAAVDVPPRKLLQMFSPGGELPVRTLFAVLAHLQKRAGLKLRAARQSA